MRRSLRWSLGVTLVLSALAVAWPEPDSSQASALTSAVGNGLARHDLPRTPEGVPAPALPDRLVALQLEPAEADPFVGAQRPPPEPPPQPVVKEPPPPPPPPPPPFNYRYLGRMQGPTGEESIYLTLAKHSVPIAVGTRLEDGYVVESIGPESISFHYPPLDTHTVLSIPAPGQDGIRTRR